MGNEGLDEEYKEEEALALKLLKTYSLTSQKAMTQLVQEIHRGADLKIELTNCALKMDGKKAQLMSLLQAYDVEHFGAILEEEEDYKAAVASEYDSSTSDTGLDFMNKEDVDLKELGQQAQATLKQQYTGEVGVEAWLNFEDDNDNGAGIDLEELGKRTRAAVDATFADELSDERGFEAA
jgi:hypothetical protein